MRHFNALALAAGLFAVVASPPVLAQSTPAEVPANVGEDLDSGVGETDSAEWVGKPVDSADGQEIGILEEVRTVTENTDGGVLVVSREGGEPVEVPFSGASFDGERVTVPVPFAEIETPPAASAN